MDTTLGHIDGFDLLRLIAAIQLLVFALGGPGFIFPVFIASFWRDLDVNGDEVESGLGRYFCGVASLGLFVWLATDLWSKAK